ncbi:guanine permease [Desulfuromonas versatilis]|uniref:Guanine permease n=1 Tax=Desulfuromonas versatilis TaxID=2802975 RepID=A0ABM8HQB6_9BACT|nr:NCS2 family permease [Desulfuromonas versatilis]BCR04309.1 guanine permease [Desulfuromonas versatilis]
MLEKLFHLHARGSNVRTEITAGVTTFLTAAYIIFVHPNILSQAGMDKGALTTVTCLVAGLATLLVALWANAPLMMAPGMGLNAFFTYTLVLGAGVPWQTALGVVFLSGVFFLVLTWLGVREKIVKAIPQSLRLATSVGIGLFIAFIGMQNLGLIVKSDAVLVALGGFSPQVLLGLFGLALAILLEVKRVRGAILLAILGTALAGMLIGISPWPAALVAVPPSPAAITFQLDILGAMKISLWASIFSFMFVDLFDSLGTMLAVCREAGMVDKDGNIPALPRMLTADALATVGGSLLGTSTTTAYIESASGVSDGGRTGLTAVVTATLFLVSALFTPLIGAVPAYATAPALMIVGIFMMRGIGQIDFYDFEEGAPAFLTFVLMPLTYSIATGLAFGMLSYVLLKLCLGKIRECEPFLIGAAIFSLISLMV